MRDLFLSIFDIQSDPKAEKLVKYYGYETSVNPFKPDKESLATNVFPVNHSDQEDSIHDDDSL